MDQSTDERIWSYVLGGMNDRERTDMERAMQDDEALRDRIKKAEEARQLYGTLIPFVDTDVDTDILVEKIVRGWEQSDVKFRADPSAVKEGAPKLPIAVDSASPPRRSAPYMRRNLLAMAACLLILASIPSFFSPDTLEWMEPQLVLLKQKGPNSDQSVSTYSTETFGTLSSELRVIINQEYEKRRTESLWSSWFRWDSDWRLQIQIHELYEGILQAEVAAYGDDPLSPLGTWMEYAESVDSFRSRIQSFGTEVATALASMTNE